MSATDHTCSHSAVLIQFAKWPETGRVKTRLIPALGPQGAMEAHVRLSRQVLTNLARSGLPVQFWWDRALAPAPASAQPLLDLLRSVGAEQKAQSGADLGERMFRALSAGLADYRRAIIVGSDCPSVDAGYVEAALAALGEYDVVLGPSDDGGYVLIGARKTVPGMLADITWGSERVLTQTLERLAGKHLTVALLEPRWDVDEPGDWQRFLRESPGFPDG
ncbi:TIGR04282 family arsenosugar biosynthesis glycosyltransferase [Marinobacter mobilis]|uniref:Glycosyltransferase n=1 Tax=Marinobacter mobilis TaxID=488533 RepID=A0A1H3DUS9_9GAMM|nr:TIGR04282 family arsenosugar biosynthesis glycosyltransferase [Marinobacter mobilis]SDX70107.1 hypothetical protein SAMN04487960_1145 [Marinobacter mobilis]